MENRVVELENKLIFQEQAVNELNDVITDQQKQLDMLREAIKILNMRVASASQTTTVSEEKEPPPPHY